MSDVQYNEDKFDVPVLAMLKVTNQVGDGNPRGETKVVFGFALF
jgi:hypothetical protein